jgi:hypothetical protein
MLARQALYHLSHASSPFCSCFLGQLGLWVSYFRLPTAAGMTNIHSVIGVMMGFVYILPWLASNYDAPNLSLPSSCD